MAENIFNEKQDYIVAARDEVIKRDEYAANIDDQEAPTGHSVDLR